MDDRRRAVGADTGPMMAQCCERLVAAGLPLWRVGVFVRTLHPDMFGRSFVWRPGAEVDVGTVDFDIESRRRFTQARWSILYSSGHEVRHRLDDPAARRFPFFEDMRTEGVTDYIAMPLHVHRRLAPRLELDHEGSRAVSPTSSSTRSESIIPPFARFAEIVTLRRTATTLLDTYVGNRAGERILAGQIRRGHADTHAGGDLAVGFARLHRAVGPAGAPRSSSISSTAISIARCRRSASMAARS